MYPVLSSASYIAGERMIQGMVTDASAVIFFWYMYVCGSMFKLQSQGKMIAWRYTMVAPDGKSLV
jgi:hypothetical protein